MRQATTQQVAMRLTKRAAVRSRDSSTRQPDFRILWNSSIFQRSAYHYSFSIASSHERTGRSVSSRQLIRYRPLGAPRSSA